MSGASGLIGSALRPVLIDDGHSTAALVRRPPKGDQVQWDPTAPLDARPLEDFDAIVHLAGKNIAARWTEKLKREVRESRVQGTHTLATAAAGAFRQTGRPKVFVGVGRRGRSRSGRRHSRCAPAYRCRTDERWRCPASHAASVSTRAGRPRWQRPPIHELGHARRRGRGLPIRSDSR